MKEVDEGEEMKQFDFSISSWRDDSCSITYRSCSAVLERSKDRKKQYVYRVALSAAYASDAFDALYEAMAWFVDWVDAGRPGVDKHGSYAFRSLDYHRWHMERRVRLYPDRAVEYALALQQQVWAQADALKKCSDRAYDGRML